MLTIATTFKKLMLLSELSDLVIKTGSEYVTVAISVIDDDTPFLQETYVPDNEGYVIIRDLADIAEKMLGSEDCKALVPDSYVTDHFLNSSSGFDKMTYVGAEELLYITSGDVSSTDLIWVHADVNYYDPVTQTVSSKNIWVENVQANDKVMSVNVSPYYFLDPFMTLLDYTVHAGNRSQKFIVMRNLIHPVSFRFRNRFGLFDSAHCFGSVESQVDVTRSIASVNKQQKAYKVVYYPSWVIKSGKMAEGSLQSVLDMLTSEEVTMLLDGYTFQVVITDHDTTITDDTDALNEIELTVQQGLSNRMPVSFNSTGIFDTTFDNSFN